MSLKLLLLLRCLCLNIAVDKYFDIKTTIALIRLNWAVNSNTFSPRQSFGQEGLVSFIRCPFILSQLKLDLQKQKEKV